jgi:hypothetical protein
MSRSPIEAKRNPPTSPQTGPGILLDRQDLNHLVLLRTLGQKGEMADPRKTVCVPRHRFAADPDLTELLFGLEKAGRVTVKEQKPTKNSYDPGRGGNIVIRSEVDDETVLAAFSDVDLSALKPLLDFQSAYPKLLTSVVIFPNFSSGNRGLKGISIHFDSKQDRWWKTLSLSGYKWPFGRGIITRALPIMTDQFLDQSEEILAKTYEFGFAKKQTTKYIRYYFGSDGRMFVVMAVGPSDQERQGMSESLKNTHKPSQAAQFMEQVQVELNNRRQDAASALVHYLNLGKLGEEEVVNVPYVTLDLEQGLGVSGGVGGVHGDILPFTTADKLVIYTDRTDNIFPLGTRRKETKNLPLTQGLEAKAVEFINSLDSMLVLSDLGPGYHPEMENNPPVRK